MWWGKGQDKPTEPAKANTAKAGFDAEKLPDREKLPAKLQKIVEKSDKEDNLYDEIVDG